MIALATLSLVLPTFTTSSGGPTYTGAQLAFAALASLVLWASFVFVQTVRHRDYFLPVHNPSDEDTHAEPPSLRQAWASLGLLMVALVGVVGLAKVLSPSGAPAVAAAGAPQSAIASIGLTIPAVALASVLIGMPLELGLEAKDLVLLALTFVVGSITIVSGRTHVMQGVVHLVIFAAFLFLAFVP